MEKHVLKKLSDFSSTELKKFFDSFDNILCDCDGVLWVFRTPVLGAQKCISKFKEMGKRIGVVTNNSTRKLEAFQLIFKEFGFDIQIDEIVIPSLAMVHYLKKINFDKEIYVIGCTVLKQRISDAGFKLAEMGEPFIEESMEALGNELSKDNEKVGAVIFDIDFNLTYAKFLRATRYLNRPDVLYIVGAGDKTGPMGLPVPLLGLGGIQESIQDLTGNPIINLGKPGKEFSEYIKSKYNINDPSRTLFIGDSLTHDIKFANMHGFQSLLVLTGTSSLKEAQTCTEDMIPNFYVNSLGDIYTLIENKLK